MRDGPYANETTVRTSAALGICPAKPPKTVFAIELSPICNQVRIPVWLGNVKTEKGEETRAHLVRGDREIQREIRR
jgi:hypothetical protein